MDVDEDGDILGWGEGDCSIFFLLFRWVKKGGEKRRKEYIK